MRKSVIEYLRQTVLHYPDKIAVNDTTEEITFKALYHNGHILATEILSHEDALITIYDVSDGRQLCRKRLFDSWFKQFNNGKLCKLEAKCLIDEQLTYTSLLYNKKHYDDKYLKEEFQELIDANFYN